MNSSPALTYLIGAFLIMVILGYASYVVGGSKAAWTYVALFVTQLVPGITVSTVTLMINGKPLIINILISLVMIVSAGVLVFGKREHRYGLGLYIVCNLIMALILISIYYS